jgi:hypothetical protein
MAGFERTRSPRTLRPRTAPASTRQTRGNRGSIPCTAPFIFFRKENGSCKRRGWPATSSWRGGAHGLDAAVWNTRVDGCCWPDGDLTIALRPHLGFSTRRRRRVVRSRVSARFLRAGRGRPRGLGRAGRRREGAGGAAHKRAGVARTGE